MISERPAWRWLGCGDMSCEVVRVHASSDAIQDNKCSWIVLGYISNRKAFLVTYKKLVSFCSMLACAYIYQEKSSCCLREIPQTCMRRTLKCLKSFCINHHDIAYMCTRSTEVQQIRIIYIYIYLHLLFVQLRFKWSFDDIAIGQTWAVPKRWTFELNFVAPKRRKRLSHGIDIYSIIFSAPKNTLLNYGNIYLCHVRLVK